MLWFIGEVALAPGGRGSEKVRSIAIAILPCLIVLPLPLLYNYARFGNALEQGYTDQAIPDIAANARNIGIFNFRHMPMNLYALVLASPVPILSGSATLVLKAPFFAANPWGMSVFVTSPWLARLFDLRHCDRTSRLILLTAVVMAVPILCYYAVGFRQFGYRYSLDFLLFLFYLLLRKYPTDRERFSMGFKIVIIVSAIWNLILFAGHYIWRLT